MIEERTFSETSDVYRGNIKGYQENVNTEKEWQKKVITKADMKIFIDEVKCNLLTFLYYQKDQTALSAEEYISCREKTKDKYTENNDLYDVEEVQEYYYWKKVIEERFKFKQLKNAIL